MSSYSRMNVELARAAASRRPGEQPRLRDIPKDAPYRGKGPLYVWTGEAWLDILEWRAMHADPRRDSDAEEAPMTVAPRKLPGREEPQTGWLFEEEATDESA